MTDEETLTREIVFDICAKGWRLEANPEELIFWSDELEKFAFSAILSAFTLIRNEAIAKEREECANLAFSYAEVSKQDEHFIRENRNLKWLISFKAKEIASAIRSRTDAEKDAGHE